MCVNNIRKDKNTTEESYRLDLQQPSNWSNSADKEIAAAQTALVRSLKYSGVKFIRYATVDAYNTVRAKATPIARISKSNDKSFDNVLSIAEVCFAGLPSYADAMVPGTNLDGRRVLTIKPDLSSLRILPYANKTAMVMGTAHDQRTGELSPLCTRGLLSRVQETAEREFGIAFSVGAELEFSLFRDGKPVDSSLFASSTTLDDQEDFISDLYDQLSAQEIEVELIHSESASGQLEVVLAYQDDVMMVADNIVLARETIRAVAKSHGMKALFLPKISAMEAGNGCHLHFSFRDLKSRTPKQNALPHPNKGGEVSPKGGSFMEGILVHLPALLSLSIPSSNSFRRVGPGCWTGHSIGWAVEDKESALRLCLDLSTGDATHVELKLSDSTANIYLELAAVLSSGLDGIARNLALRPMLGDGDTEKDPLPASLLESLKSLKKDEYLGHVLGPELSTAYVAVREAEAKRSEELSLEDEVSVALQRA